jgi:hypothetical protein
MRFVVVERTGNDASYPVRGRHPPRQECEPPAARTRPLTGGHHHHHPGPGQALATDDLRITSDMVPAAGRTGCTDST